MASSLDLRISADAPALFQAAATEFASRALARVKATGRFTVALSGGSTPRSFFSVLAKNDRDPLPWDKIFFFWGDERHVPPDHPESNYRMAFEALLSKVPVPAGNIFRVSAESPHASQAAAAYDQTVRDFFRVPAGVFPRFDLILLGMGPDAHTASLFPGTTALLEKKRLVVANWVEKFKTDRITLTLPVINQAAAVMFVVSGHDKAAALKEVLEGTQPGELYPSKLIHPTNSELIWLVDQAAASALSKTQ